MEHFDLVEKLVNTFGVSYEEAKIALEKAGWDPVEAAVILERAKNGMPEPETPKANPNVKGSAENTNRADWKQDGSRFFKSMWDFVSLNEFVVKKSTGEVFLNIPLWLTVLLLCAFFWPVVIILGIVFLMGYRFCFDGPQLGKKNVKDAVEHAEDLGKDFVDRVKNSVAPENDTPVDPECFSGENNGNEVKSENGEAKPEEPSSDSTDPFA